MLKIGLITLIDNNNYGNRLQNYALYKILVSLGATVDNIENYPFTNNKKNYFLKHIKYLKFDRFYSSNKERKDNFFSFNRKINYYNHLFCPYNTYKEMNYMVCGSDQVWNPKFGVSECTLLANIPPNKRISYAASFGVDIIPKELLELYKTELSKFKSISVREESGARIVKELTGRDAAVVVDPTLLLSRTEWSQISKKPKNVKEGFILTYFLSPKCNSAKAKLEEIQGEKYIYELSVEDDEVTSTAGPLEFLWLFDHADIILTDSFHACVFSFLFNKPFIVYDRNWDGGNMNSRLETLLSKFHLERKYANSGIENDIWEHDYTEGYKQLEIERKKAIDFIKKALED